MPFSSDINHSSDPYFLIFLNIFISDLSNISLFFEIFMYTDNVILLKSFHPFDVLAAYSALSKDLRSIA